MRTSFLLPQAFPQLISLYDPCFKGLEARSREVHFLFTVGFLPRVIADHISLLSDDEPFAEDIVCSFAGGLSSKRGPLPEAVNRSVALELLKIARENPSQAYDLQLSVLLSGVPSPSALIPTQFLDLRENYWENSPFPISNFPQIPKVFQRSGFVPFASVVAQEFEQQVPESWKGKKLWFQGTRVAQAVHFLKLAYKRELHTDGQPFGINPAL